MFRPNRTEKLFTGTLNNNQTKVSICNFSYVFSIVFFSAAFLFWLYQFLIIDALTVLFGLRCEKTGLRGFRPGPTQTGLHSHRGWLEALNFGFR